MATPNVSRNIPSLMAVEIDFNMIHYDEETKTQATGIHNLMLAQDVSIPPRVICDLIKRYKRPRPEEKVEKPQ